MIAEKEHKEPMKKETKSKKKNQNKKELPTPEDILEELVRNDMIKKSIYSKFHEFHGEVSYIASQLRKSPRYLNPPYGLGDIIQVGTFGLEY